MPGTPLDQTQCRPASRRGLSQLAVLDQHFGQVKTRQQGGDQAAARLAKCPCIRERLHRRTGVPARAVGIPQ
jgi:hypothetical protein